MISRSRACFIENKFFINFLLMRHLCLLSNINSQPGSTQRNIFYLFSSCNTLTSFRISSKHKWPSRSYIFDWNQYLCEYEFAYVSDEKIRKNLVSLSYNESLTLCHIYAKEFPISYIYRRHRKLYYTVTEKNYTSNACIIFHGI